MIYYVIPAREGSKGFPHKNRKLFEFTAKTLEHIPNDVIVSTDDEEVKEQAGKFGFNVLGRPEDLANDTASMRDVLINIVNESQKAEITVPTMNPGDIFVMLYLTYYQRTWPDIMSALNHYLKNRATSLLCRQEPKTHPCLCVYPDGSQVINHNLYRRQDYPKIYEISHFVSIMQVDELKRLNKNLYNENTVYYDVDRVVDVDYEKDFLELQNEKS